MATYYVIARLDGTRFTGSGRVRVDLSDALRRGVTYFVPGPSTAVDADEDSDEQREPVGLLLHPDPAQAGLGIVDDMTLSLGVDGGFRLFQLQAVPAPENYVPTSEVGAAAIVSREFLVLAEVPAWWAYGPNGRQVGGLLEAIAGLDRAELEAIGARVDAEPDAALDRFAILTAADGEIAATGRIGAARLARGYARAATYRSWERNPALGRAASFAGDVAHVLTVGDRIDDATRARLLRGLAPEITAVAPADEETPYGEVSFEVDDDALL